MPALPIVVPFGVLIGEIGVGFHHGRGHLLGFALVGLRHGPLDAGGSELETCAEMGSGETLSCQR